jgi:hypothetical protein
MSIPARSRAIIVVVEIRRSSGCGCGSSLFNFAVEFAGSTSAKVAGEEEKGKDDGTNAYDRENSGHCAFIVNETIIR